MAFLGNEAGQGGIVVRTSELAARFSRRRQIELREPAMVDRVSLEFLGLVLGGVTAVVIAIAAIVVHSHVNTKSAATALDRASPTAAVTRIPPVVPVALSPRR